MNRSYPLNLKINPFIFLFLLLILGSSCKFNPKVLLENEEDQPTQTEVTEGTDNQNEGNSSTENPTGNPHSTNPEVVVDPELVDYLDAFRDEGEKRGWTIDISKISATLIERDNSTYTGLCSFDGRNYNSIVIDQAIWKTLDPFMKELVMFHELGHCVLERSHREVIFTDGTCGSIMRSGLGTCFDNYNTNTRISYLNELYDPQMAFAKE